LPSKQIGKERIWFRYHDGSEPGLLFVHGAGGNSLSWILQYRHFRGKRIIVQPDLPGHGKSTGDGRESLVAYARFLKNLVTELGLSRVVVAGHSMGGGIALEFAINYPDLVEGLVLAGTGARLTVSGRIIDLVSTNPAALPKLLSKWICAPGVSRVIIKRSIAMLEQTDPKVLQKDFEACKRLDLTPEIDRIEAPAVVITGMQDRMTPVIMGRQLTQGLPNARHVILEGAGHMVMVEKAQEFNSTMDSFLHEIAQHKFRYR